MSQKKDTSTLAIKERTLSICLGEAIKYTTVTGAVSTAGVLYMLQYRPWFKKSTNVSVRVAIPTMVALFTFGLSFELTMVAAQRHPERWGLAPSPDNSKKVPLVIPFHHWVMNRVYDHPWVTMTVLGAPLAGLILNTQLKLKHLTLSQRIMHTRVFAQAGILTIALTTLGFREYMERNGRFPEGPQAAVPTSGM